MRHHLTAHWLVGTILALFDFGAPDLQDINISEARPAGHDLFKILSAIRPSSDLRLDLRQARGERHLVGVRGCLGIPKADCCAICVANAGEFDTIAGFFGLAEKKPQNIVIIITKNV